MSENNCNERHCVFWYPTIYLSDLNAKATGKVTETDFIDISDKAKGTYKRFLKIELKNGNLIIHSKTGIADHPKGIITLEQIGVSNNGFVKYSYSIPPLDSSKTSVDLHFYKNFERLLQTEIYHLAKSFYHEHEVNHTADCGLKAYLCKKTEGEDIYRIDNLPLIDYLSQFNDSFQKYAQSISKANKKYDTLLNNLFPRIESIKAKDIKTLKVTGYQKIDKLLNSIEHKNNPATNSENPIKEQVFPNNTLGRKTRKKIKRKIDKLKVKKQYILRNQLGAINDLCENALIEYAYCKTLLESKYNKGFKHTIDVSEEEIVVLNKLRKAVNCPAQTLEEQGIKNKDENRKKALNIRNSIRYIECVKFKCINRSNDEVDYHVKKLDASGKTSFKVAKISLTLGVASVVLSILIPLFYDSFKGWLSSLLQ